jgi:hypothetical protein
MTNGNDKWECFLCCKEDDFDILPSAYLGNYQPLCERCADEVVFNRHHSQRYRLSYHKDFGDIVSIKGRKVKTTIAEVILEL